MRMVVDVGRLQTGKIGLNSRHVRNFGRPTSDVGLLASTTQALPCVLVTLRKDWAIWEVFAPKSGVRHMLLDNWTPPSGPCPPVESTHRNRAHYLENIKSSYRRNNHE